VKHIDNKTIWKLCANSLEERNNWVCAIQKALGQICNLDISKIEVIKRKIVKQPVIIIPVPAPMCNEKWDYSSHGEDWQCDCSEGFAQSPINLPDLKSIPETYNRTLFSFFDTDKDENGKPFEIIFENHMLKIKGIMGSLVTWELIKYELFEVQFHTHSEHTIKNEVFDMEVQFYFRAITPGCLRKTAALAILFKVVPGSKNLFFDKTINILDLPDRFEKKKKLLKPLNLKHLFMLDSEDSYEGFSYYTYEGSFTSPPCQGKLFYFFNHYFLEETTWFVTSSPLPISYTTIEYFRDILKPQTVIIIFKIFKKKKKILNIKFDADLTCMKLELTIDENIQDNVRKIQNSSKREIYYYDNHCNKVKKPKKSKPLGHFEKVDQKITNYFYVSDDKPSGIPNSFVVSPGEALGVNDSLPSDDDMNIMLMK